ncbi:hypothetical protein WJX77_007734 [Trebouxia sp. C0004]
MTEEPVARRAIMLVGLAQVARISLQEKIAKYSDTQQQQQQQNLTSQPFQNIQVINMIMQEVKPSLGSFMRFLDTNILPDIEIRMMLAPGTIPVMMERLYSFIMRSP